MPIGFYLIRRRLKSEIYEYFIYGFDIEYIVLRVD